MTTNLSLDERPAASTATEHPRTRDLRVRTMGPLLRPGDVLRNLPLSDAAAATVARTRGELVRILNGDDSRLLVVVGPCSVHDPEAGIDYARRLRQLASDVADDLLIVMRLYFEKPRTTVGWKGLINDPHLDGTYASNEGLTIARQLLLAVVELGLPVGCEFLDPISPQFISDAVTWGAIGARTSESQVHRGLASGLSMPIGFKNSTDGRVSIAMDAVKTASHPHSFFGVDEDGRAAIVLTDGNPDCHIVLRGSAGTPNHGAASVQQALAALREHHLPARVIIDASHDNSAKDYRRQPLVAGEIAQQVAAGEGGIRGVMLESFLVDGRQDLRQKDSLVYGQSITDACMGWEMTLPVLRELAQAARARRAALPATA